MSGGSIARAEVFLCKNECRWHTCPYRGILCSGGCKTGKDCSSARAEYVEGRVLRLWFVAENQAESMTGLGIRD